MRIIRREAHRRVAFLIAEKSMKRPLIGFGANLVGAVPVGRALDSTKPAKGKIYLPDPDNNPLLVRGYGTNFEIPDFQIGGLLVLPTVNHTAASAEILEIIGPEEIKLKKPFGGSTAINQLTGRERVIPDGMKDSDIPKEFAGCSYGVAPKIDQSGVYNSVFQTLENGGSVGIFPEGGSHDRPELLPFKG
jgi:glycerol-3-phosphate O-acyltransferase / dihydroxyacetone phosphate acyltransferase